MKRFTEEQIRYFRDMIQCRLPNCIVAYVINDEISRSMQILFRFPDGHDVTYVYALQDDTELTENLAIHCIRCMLDTSLTNLNNQLKLLQNIGDSL